MGSRAELGARTVGVRLLELPRWAILCLVAGLGLGFAHCGEDDGDGRDVVVQRPQQFQSDLPEGWRVVLPARGPGGDLGTDNELTPIFSAYSPEHEGVTFAVFDEPSTDLESAGQAWMERTIIELSQFKLQEEGGRSVLEASGRGELGGRSTTMRLAIVTFSSAKQSWVLQCTVWESSDEQWCRRLIDGFGPFQQ